MFASAVFLFFAAPAMAAPETFTVTSTGDEADQNVGDGLCQSVAPGNPCTLRAAIEEANFNSPQLDTIDLTGVTGQIALTSVLPSITDSVTINGPGADQLAIDGANMFRVLEADTGTTTSITGLTISHGQAPVISGGAFSGGILSEGNMTLDGVVVRDNHAAVTGAPAATVSALGGGIRSDGGTLTLVRSTVKNNDATAVTSGTGTAIAKAGGIDLESSAILQIHHSTINGNQASATITSGTDGSATNSTGGGISQGSGTLTIDESTITGNTATGAGGVNAFASDSAEGGGVDQNSGSLTVTGSTVSGNATSVPAGPHEAASGANFELGVGGTFQDSIVANPIGASNCGQGTFTSNGYNLEDTDTCNFTQTTDISNKDPMLGPLAANGGPTQTMELLQGSPAIDQGKSFFGATTDQRDTGFPRISDSPAIPNPTPDGDGSDIGAFERDSVPPKKPVILASIPKSPANANQPKLKGAAEAGSLVRIYKSAGCTGSPVGHGFAAAFKSPGIGVSVPNNSTTVFHATSTDASNNTSACSNGFTYVEDSKPPNTSINSLTVSRAKHLARITFSSNEAGSTFRCRIDGGAFSACTSPKTFTGLALGSHTVRVVARDRAGNVDATPASKTFTL